MKKPIIAGNWKMNNTKAEAEQLITALKPLVKDVTRTDVVVCVPFTCIEKVKKLVKGSKIKVGAQNVAWADKGAFTGEISAAMLKEVGAEYVIIGHSERRQYFGETDKSVNMRLVQALKNELKPIVCVGETLDERNGGKTEIVLRTQLEGGLEGLTADDMKNVGTGKHHHQVYQKNACKDVYSSRRKQSTHSVRRKHERQKRVRTHGYERHRRRSYRRCFA